VQDESFRLAVPLVALILSLVVLAIVAQWASIRALRERVSQHAERIKALEEAKRAELYPPHDRASTP
jgi:hypothetical protein